jgi:hypothetical protein
MFVSDAIVASFASAALSQFQKKITNPPSADISEKPQKEFVPIPARDV